MDYENIQKDGQRDKNMILQPGLPVKTEKLWNDAAINNTGIYAEYSINIKSFDLVGSARLDINNANSGDIVIQHPMLGEIYNYSSDSIKSNFTNFSFSFGVTKILTKKLSISLSAGRGVRSPDMTERYIILLPIGYDPFDYLGNPQLEPEANNQIDLTLQFKCEKSGMAQINGFYSLVNNFITGQRIPPSIQKPLTKDVLGVKQFYNAGNARFTGFEFVYSSPSRYKLGGQLFAAYTYGTIDQVKKYVLNRPCNVIDDEILENDAVSEIPPFDATISVHYRFLQGKLMPKANLRLVASQKHVSEAQYEQSSAGFVVAGISVNYIFNKYLNISAGVSNLFNEAYYEHLNRNIIGTTTNLYEPGRIAYINLMFKI
ncbi:MAG: TonB-dependent receptor [Bacteroidales bacterium]